MTEQPKFTWKKPRFTWEKVEPVSFPKEWERWSLSIENPIRKEASCLGYHKREIPQGEFGTASKVLEEAFELVEAEEQQAKIMVLCELSDLYGAMEAVATRHGFTMNDIRVMSELNKEAFKNGGRKPK